MPVYLAPVREDVDPLDGSPWIRPPVEGPGVGWVHLGPAGTSQGRALIYVPDPVADPRWDKIGETDKREVLGLQTRTVISNRLGLTLREVALDAILGELLMDHGAASRWRGIRGFPSRRRNRYEIHLGALGLVWSQPVAARPSTQSFTETWPTAGSITASQDQTWTVLDGTPTVVSGAVRPTNASEATTGRCEAVLDTADQVHSATFVLVDDGSNIHQVRTVVRCLDDDNGYFANAVRRSGGAGHLRHGQKRVGGSLTTIVTGDTSDPGATGTISVEIDGSTMTITIGDLVDATATDASPALTTQRKGGFLLFAVTDTAGATLDSHTIADVVAGAGAEQFVVAVSQLAGTGGMVGRVYV